MKKVLSLILATLLVLTSIAAVAEEVLPSKTTSDLAEVTEVAAENGEVVLTVVEESDKYVEVLAATVEAVLNGTAPADLFTADTKAAIVEKAGEAELELNEMVAIAAPDYTAENGAVTAKFTFETLYTAEQTLIAVVSCYTGEAVEEIVLDAKADEAGAVVVSFTADAMAKIAAADSAILAILNTK